MFGSETAWEGAAAAVSFCEDVMLANEAAERDREIDSPLAPVADARGAEGRLPICVLHKRWPAVH